MSDDGISNPGANSVSGRQGLRGDLAGARYPSLSMSFDQAVASLNLISDDAFGTANAPAGANLVTDATALGVRFQSYRNSELPTATRNTEVERYVDFSHAANLVFASDAMEIRATLPNGMPVAMASTTVVGAVSSSRTVTVADASAITVGQIVSQVGDAQNTQVHQNRTFAFRSPVATPIASGDIFTLAITLPDGSTVTPTVVADGSSTTQTLAQAMVEAVNGTASLTALGLFAFKDPNCPGGYVFCVPQWPTQTEQFGNFAQGSVRWPPITPTKTGVGFHEFRSGMLLTHVLAKSGNTLTLNHPVTMADGATLNITPSVMVMRSSEYAGGSTTIPIADTTPFAVGQMCYIGSETGLRFIISKTANSLTVSGSNIFFLDGYYIIPLAAWASTVSAVVTAGSILSFAAVPAGVRVGQQASQYGVNPNSNLKVLSINRASTPQTVTLDGTITLASGNTVIFHEPIESVQCWTKNGIAPGVNGKTFIAIELEADWPGLGDPGAWPASWLYRDGTQLTGLAAPGGGQNEVDLNDPFYYWGVPQSACYWPAAVGVSTEIYRIAGHNGTYLQGNNLGRGTRKVQLVWTTAACYFYLDGTLILAKSHVFNNSAFAQLAFNLAVGSMSTSFNQNGFFPVDWSRFPMKLRVRRQRVWSAPDATPVAL